MYEHGVCDWAQFLSTGGAFEQSIEYRWKVRMIANLHAKREAREVTRVAASTL